MACTVGSRQLILCRVRPQRMRLWILILIAPSLAVASEDPVLHAWDNGPPGIPPSSATATFKVPKGWSEIRLDPKYGGSERYSLCPTELLDTGDRPVIQVLFAYMDFTAPYTQLGQARSYLEATHRHADDKVRMRRVGVVHHREFGPVHLFHYYSDYWGERLRAKITAAPLGVSVELTCRRAGDLKKYRPDFEALLRTVRMRGAKFSHEDDPRRLQRGW